MEETTDDVFLGVMDLQEAKNHQYGLKAKGIHIALKSNGETCTTGCKVTVEVWGKAADLDSLKAHFTDDYLKHVKGHVPNFEAMNCVFDKNAAETTCQACGTKFSTTATECPDCGLVYG